MTSSGVCKHLCDVIADVSPSAPLEAAVKADDVISRACARDVALHGQQSAQGARPSRLLPDLRQQVRGDRSQTPRSGSGGSLAEAVAATKTGQTAHRSVKTFERFI